MKSALLPLSALLLSSVMILHATELSVWPVAENLAPARWRVAGPFLQEASTAAGDAGRAGLDRDYLAPAGGEASATVPPADDVLMRAGATTVREVPANADGGFNLGPAFAETAFRVAYAWGKIISPADQDTEFRFGSDDGAKVWVNGREVWRIATPGRPVVAGEDVFTVGLRQGENAVLVKVENGSGEWGFALTVLDETGRARAEALEVRRGLTELRLRPRSRSGYLLLEGRFPKLAWENPVLAGKVFTSLEPEVTWYGESLEPVAAPAGAGRYFAHVRQGTIDGFVHERLLSFCRPRDLGWDPAIPPYGPAVTMDVPPGLVYWREPAFAAGQRVELSRQFWQGLGHLLTNEEAGAAFLAWAESAPTEAATENFVGSALNADAGWKLRLRLKLLGREPVPLLPVAREAPAAPVLRMGTEAEAGLAPGTVERLRASLREWVAADPLACRALVARRGIIFFHEAAGDDRGRPADMNDAFPPASIGKFVAGVMLGCFLDQRLLLLDDPVGTVLPGWPTEGPKAVTFRQCFAHLSGLTGHNSHGGLLNPMLDAAFAVEDLPFVEPGREHRYGGDGNNLAGKAMELLSGKTMFELLYEYLQVPLEAEDTLQVDLGFGSAYRPLFLARIGQMMLNHGAYGEHRFFARATQAELLPRSQKPFNPDLNPSAPEWGVGVSWMPDVIDPGEPPVAGPRVYGHGAASSSMFRVDPDRELVVVVGRVGTTDWGVAMRQAAKFMAAIVEGCR